ncbi:MAG: TetR/AcrR family transcriptional regulator [Anaerolineales bacterium]|nr:TetR/AcrR family transcriptional regulator [Anaerolineales bacterium]
MQKVNNNPSMTHRQRQALETRRLIVEAARVLFLDQGYAATTIEGLALQAGVSVSTVYSIFGSKRGILRGIREAWHQESHIREVIFSTTRDVDPASRLDHLAHATRRQWETGADVVSIYQGAVAADREAASELADALEGRRSAFDALVASLRSGLRPGLSLDQAAAVLRALCLPEVHAELVSQSGWTEDAYEVWLAASLKRELLP